MAGKPLTQVNPLQFMNLEHITILEVEEMPPQEWQCVTVWLSGQTTRWIGEIALRIMQAKGVVSAKGELPKETKDALLMKKLEIAKAVPQPHLLDARQAQAQQGNGGPAPRPLT